MKKFKITWYDHVNTKEDGYIMAINKEDATRMAYEKYNGNPPYCQLLVDEVV